MFRYSLIAASALFVCASATAQNNGPQAAKITAPVKDAGVYHMATGTWTRNSSATANIGPMVIYNNDANTGYFGLYAAGEEWIDNGRLPSTSSPSPVGSSDDYNVNGIQTAYCSSNATGSFDLNIGFWNMHGGACNDPTNGNTTAPDTLVTITGMPGGSMAGVTGCWLVTVDLAGGDEFCLVADGDGVYDGLADIDGFGVSFAMSDTSGGNAGPFLNGDPNVYPFGDGTDFQNPGLTGTGLDTDDLFYLNEPSQTYQGCYWFGGYPTNPYSSFWWQLSSDGACGGGPSCGDQGATCTSNANSSGGVGDLGFSGSCVIGDANFTLTASSVPNNAGLFIYSNGSIDIPFGDGRLCVNGSAGILRLYPLTFATGNATSNTIDLGNPPSSAGQITGGTTWYFQHWHRDPGFGSAQFNLTNAHAISFS
jgi:hypothetical protein